MKKGTQETECLFDCLKRKNACKPDFVLEGGYLSGPLIAARLKRVYMRIGRASLEMRHSLQPAGFTTAYCHQYGRPFYGHFSP